MIAFSNQVCIRLDPELVSHNLSNILLFSYDVTRGVAGHSCGAYTCTQ